MRDTKHSPVARRWRLALTSALPVLLSLGCSTMSNTDKGLLGGAAVGAGAGALIGNAAGHHAGAGAVIGGLVGAVTGAAVGNSVDEKERREAAQRDAAARGPLGLEEIAKLSQSGVGDQVIVDQIRLSRVAYQLTAEQIIWLKQSHVSDYVISFMQQTGYGRRVYVPPVVYGPPPPVVVVEEGPPPPPHIGVGFTYVGGRR